MTAANAQSTGEVTTFAGSNDTYGHADGIGVAAQFNDPRGIAVDSWGTLWVADTFNNAIRKITTPTGVVTTFAGGAGGHTDGTGLAAQFYQPYGIAVDSKGTLWVADTYNHAIRKVTATAVVSTFAGSIGTDGRADGTGVAAQFYYPFGIAVDSKGTLCVADTYNHAIRKITPTGVVTTFAGSIGTYGRADGNGLAAQFSSPSGIAVDSGGTLWVVDLGNDAIRKVNPAAVVTTFAGGARGHADGTGLAAQFSSPGGIAVDSGGTLWVVDTANSAIRKITPTAVVTTFAGSIGRDGYVDGTGTAAQLYSPFGIAVDARDTLWVADTHNFAIRKIVAATTFTTADLSTTTTITPPATTAPSTATMPSTTSTSSTTTALSTTTTTPPSTTTTPSATTAPSTTTTASATTAPSTTTTPSVTTAPSTTATSTAVLETSISAQVVATVASAASQVLFSTAITALGGSPQSVSQGPQALRLLSLRTQCHTRLTSDALSGLAAPDPKQFVWVFSFVGSPVAGALASSAAGPFVTFVVSALLRRSACRFGTTLRQRRRVATAVATLHVAATAYYGPNVASAAGAVLLSYGLVGGSDVALGPTPSAVVGVAATALAVVLVGAAAAIRSTR